jgi:hypothetical protein
MPTGDTAHLTLPSLRDGPLPLPPQAGGERPSPATQHVQANMCAYPSAKAGVQACPWQGTGGKRLKFLDSRLRGNDGVSAFDNFFTGSEERSTGARLEEPALAKGGDAEPHWPAFSATCCYSKSRSAATSGVSAGGIG